MLGEITAYAKGNPGALQFLVEVISEKHHILAIPIMMRIEECKTIRGANLYVLYADLANKNMGNVFEICNKVPSKVLEDACSRQDRSGRELIAKYLK